MSMRSTKYTAKKRNQRMDEVIRQVIALALRQKLKSLSFALDFLDSSACPLDAIFNFPEISCQ